VKTAQPHVTPKEVFYGWWIVLGSTAILFISSGIGFYGQGVILDPLRAQYGWSKGTISSAITMYFAISGAMGIVVGRLIDRYGPKSVLIVGSVTIGFGFVLLSRVTQLWQLFAVYFLMAVGWSGTSLVPIGTLITSWHIRRRGFAMGLTMTGLSLGGMVLVPLAVFLISHWGLRTALPILGGAFWLVVIPVAVFIVKQRPSDVGQFPDGERPKPLTGEKPGTRIHCASQMRVWAGAEVMRTAAFWSIVAAFLLALAGQNAFLVHQVSFLSQTLGPMGAASAVSVTTGASIVGRLILGPISDRYDKRFVAIFCFLIQAMALLSLSLFRQVTILYLGTFAFGLTMGGVLMMQSLLIGECFGMVSFAPIAGLSMLFSGLGAALGPAIAGLIYDATEDYRIAFIIFTVTSLLAIAAVFFARPPKPAVISEKGAAP
jgi:MFS family permease